MRDEDVVCVEVTYPDANDIVTRHCLSGGPSHRVSLCAHKESEGPDTR